MSIFDSLRNILGIKSVRVGDLANAVATPPGVSRNQLREVRPAEKPHGISDIEVIAEYQQVRALIDQGAPLIFATGGAGTGKSTLIRYLQNTLPYPMAVVAPTGVAALNVHGATIHSLFRLPPKVIQPADIRRVQDRQLYGKLQLLIIDEISMVRPDVLDGVDLFLRLNREDKRPFGGVQILLVGDLFQLPPVAKSDEYGVLSKMGYTTTYFFGSKGLADCPLAPVFLQRVFRQRDPEFVGLLNRLREGTELAEVLSAINARYVPLDEPAQRQLVLTSTNHLADGRNWDELLRLPGPERRYEGKIEGDFRVAKDRLPSPLNLDLRVGAQVMFTKNDTKGRWVNGTLGQVVTMGTTSVQVALADLSQGQVIDVTPDSWDQYRYEYDSTQDQIVAEVMGRYTQIPLMLAWAVTIHKAQGKTLSRVFVDLGNRAFAAGQVYVALSRVRSLSDIYLARPVRMEEVYCDPEVRRFYELLLKMTLVKDGEPPGESESLDPGHVEPTPADRVKKLDGLRHTFIGWGSTSTNPRMTGYGLEDLSRDLFEVHGIRYRSVDRTASRTLDGHFRYRDVEYAVDAQWRTAPAEQGEVRSFASMVEKRISHMCGLMISLHGYTPEVLSELRDRQCRNLILMDGRDLSLVLEGVVSLTEALDWKIDKACQRGRLFAPLSELRVRD